MIPLLFPGSHRLRCRAARARGLTEDDIRASRWKRSRAAAHSGIGTTGICCPCRLGNGDKPRGAAARTSRYSHVRRGLSLCSHSIAISAKRWPDVRLSDIEPKFTCQACGHRAPISVAVRRTTQRSSLVIKTSQTRDRLSNPAFKKPAGKYRRRRAKILRSGPRCASAKGIDPTRQRTTIKMIDQQLARLRTHRSNIQRYRNLLQTSLTELERQFVEKRLTEEQSKLESLAASLPQ